MDSIKIPKQTSLKNKLIVFSIFFCILSLRSFGWVNDMINFEPFPIGTDSLYIDGTDFSPAADILTALLNVIYYAIGMSVAFIANILIILIETLIFNKFYFKSICPEEDHFNRYIKFIIWGFSITGILINIFTNLDHDIDFILLSVLHIYLPLPVLVQILVSLKSRKTYKILAPPESKLNDGNKIRKWVGRIVIALLIILLFLYIAKILPIIYALFISDL